MDSVSPKPRLRDQFRAVIRVNHYSIRTEKSYWYWIRYFIRFHKMRHPLELGPAEVNAFLSWLATDRHVAAATQNLALNAIVFLYARVLEQPLGDIGETVRVKRPPRLPVVLTHAEAMAIIERLAQPYQLMASLMYGAGLRVVETARLRIKDIDFSRQIITVRDGKVILKCAPHRYTRTCWARVLLVCRALWANDSSGTLPPYPLHGQVAELH